MKLLLITVPQLIRIEYGLYLEVEFDIASGGLMQRIETLWP